MIFLETETPTIHEIVGLRGRIGLLHELGDNTYEMEFWDVVTGEEMREIVERIKRGRPTVSNG